ncbi:MAG: rhomboid family intramembrane serine protease, partial [Bacteroidales bacterium]
HLFFNMFSLWMFGGIIERSLGSRRFLTYYLICGIGAGLCQELWQLGEFYMEGMSGYEFVDGGIGAPRPLDRFLNRWTTIVASGACYGVLLAFGMLYPNERIVLLIPPIPIKAKYFVAGYAAIELYSAYASNDNIAHFAHLGGMLFGFLLLRYWRRANERRQAAWQNSWGTAPQKPSLAQRVKNWWGNIFQNSRPARPGNARHTATRQSDYEYNMNRHAEEQRREARMDEILEKIKKSGYENLTEDEKRELFRLSRK